MKYAIGTKFIPLSDKKNRVHTIIDLHTTRNLSGELVREVYIATREFLGQSVKCEVCEVTIARGLIQD